MYLFRLASLLFILSSCNYLPDAGDSTVFKTETKISDVIYYFESNASDLTKVDQFWDDLKMNHHIPYTHNDSVLFLYRGSASSVSWQGDFSGWSQDKSVQTEGTQINGTDIFYLKLQFPNDARIDYKIVVNSDWILDPNNPNQQWSGFGPNSELKMPKYEDSPYLQLQSGVESGTLSSTKTIESTNLNYTVGYKIWVPAQYDTTATERYKMLYVTDGQEYADNKLGALTQVAANLIHEKKITPFIIVFISPLNPTNSSQNRRVTEYVLNPNYSAFLVNELIPKVEASYFVSGKAEDRAILGTSLGGLHSAYIMATQSNFFKRIGIHSPAFWYKPEIFTLVETLTVSPETIYMTTGTIHDTETEANQMKTLFDKKGWKNGYMKVNEGHSWGNWSGTMDEMLIHLFPAINTSISHD